MYICQICKKFPASIHLTDIHNNVKKEVHICEACAKEKGFNIQTAANLPQLLGLAAKKGAFGKQAAALSSAVAAAPQPAPKRRVEAEDAVCPICGFTWKRFTEQGRLGCPGDYQHFGDRLRRMIASQLPPRVSRSGPFHVGKIPGRVDPAAAENAKAVRSLERRLREAAAEEDYERAARLKSELDALTRKAAGKTENAD